ncbi:MAG: hypothetical protein AAB434_07465 [Planctomycetota bacterium]
MRPVLVLCLFAACACAEEVRLELDPRLVITPLPEVRFEEPSVIAIPEPTVDLPLPDLDLVEALGLEAEADQAARMDAGAAEPVWTPPEEVGVAVRPVSELLDAAEAEQEAAGGARFEPILAYARADEEDDGGSGGGVGLVTEEGLVPKGFQNFTLPPLARDAPTITFRIERSEPDPFAEFAARVRRSRR